MAQRKPDLRTWRKPRTNRHLQVYATVFAKPYGYVYVLAHRYKTPGMAYAIPGAPYVVWTDLLPGGREAPHRRTFTNELRNDGPGSAGAEARAMRYAHALAQRVRAIRTYIGGVA